MYPPLLLAGKPASFFKFLTRKTTAFSLPLPPFITHFLPVIPPRNESAADLSDTQLSA